MNKKLRAVLDEVLDVERWGSCSDKFVSVERTSVNQLRLLLKIEDERKDLRKDGIRVK